TAINGPCRARVGRDARLGSSAGSRRVLPAPRRALLRRRGQWRRAARSSSVARGDPPPLSPPGRPTGPAAGGPVTALPWGRPRMSTNLRTAVTLADFARWKAEGRKIAALTAYDYTMAQLLDAAGADFLLVGDSLGTVVQGWDSTLRVTLDQMVYHAEMVARAARRALVVADLPFLSYQASREQAILSAGRFLKETQCHAVKLEGGRRMAETIQ